MHKGIVALTLAAALMSVGAAAQSPAPQDQSAPAKPDLTTVSGLWKLELILPASTMEAEIDLAQDGKAITGSLKGDMGRANVEGEFADGKISFSVSLGMGGGMDVYFEGKMKKDGTLSGTASLGQFGEIDWSAKRPKVKLH